MNRIVFIFSLLITSCQFNQSVNKDLTTGAYSRGNGLGCDDVTMEINSHIENRNIFTYGEKVNFIFNNIEGFQKRKNTAYPGLSMLIIKNKKDTVLSYQDLLKNLNEGTDLTPLLLQANFVAALPYRNNENYITYISIWDKNGDGTFDYELPFKIRENDFLNISETDMKYTNIYLWDQTLNKPILDKHINSEHEIILIFEGIDGLKKINQKVYPILSIDLIDGKGNKIISDSNMLSDYEFDGVSAKDLKDKVTASITFKEGQINNPLRLIATLTDNNSSSEIKITTELEIR